jgi:hypothetical protein
LLVRNHQVELRNVLCCEFPHPRTLIGQPLAERLSSLSPRVREAILSRHHSGAVQSVGNRLHLALIIGKSRHNLLEHWVSGWGTSVVRKDREREIRLKLTASLNHPKKRFRESGGAIRKGVAEEPTAAILK